MKRRLLAAAVLMSAWSAHSQVGIGTLTPNSSSQLDVVANDKGVLLPRVSLTSTTDSTTVPVTVGESSTENSLLVFNTNTQNDVTPGYYYWYVDKWMRIVNEDEIIALDKNTTNQGFSVEDGLLILTDSEGNFISIPLTEINIPTTIVQNPDGTYTYTNEHGQSITIDATNNIINNIENILNNTEVLNELITVLGDTYVGGNVYYDGDTFTYIDESGDTHEITIDVVGDVVTNIQNQGDIYSEILNILEQESDTFVDNQDGTFTHTTVDGEVITFDANTLSFEQNTDGSYTFTNANGETITVDVVGDVVTNIQNQGDIYSEILNILEQESDTFVDNQDGTFTHTTVDGEVITFDANTLSFEQNTDGSYTFTNANGETITVDVVGDVVTNIQNQGDIYSEILNILEQESDTFVDNQDRTFTHTTVDGEVITFDANTLSFEQNTDGSYTFTNANGETITVDVVGDVVTNIQNQGDIYSEILNILEQESDTFVDNQDGTFTHTTVDGEVITFDANTLSFEQNTDDSYTFTNANGETITVDVVGDVVTNIQNQGDIYSEIINILEQESDTFVDNNDGTFTHTTVDGEVITFDANTLSFEQNTDGSYTFTNANGETITVDVVGDVVTNIQNQGDIYSEILNILEQESDTFVDNQDGTFTHTTVDGEVITFDANTLSFEQNTDGSYTFTNANGETITIDVVGDVVTNITNNGAIYTEIINIIDKKSDVLVGNEDDGSFTHTSVDGEVVTIDIVSKDPGNEITVGTDGGAYYKKAINDLVSIDNNHTLADDVNTVIIDTAVNPVTITIPAAAAANDGRKIVLRKTNGGGQLVTISETVQDGAMSFTQFNTQATITIQSDGTNWHRVY